MRKVSEGVITPGPGTTKLDRRITGSGHLPANMQFCQGKVAMMSHGYRIFFYRAWALGSDVITGASMDTQLQGLAYSLIVLSSWGTVVKYGFILPISLSGLDQKVPCRDMTSDACDKCHGNFFFIPRYKRVIMELDHKARLPATIP